MIYKYKRRNEVLVIQWDNLDETVKLINKEMCSKIPECKARRASSDRETLFISTKRNDAGGLTVNDFYRVGDYIVYDINQVRPIAGYDQDKLNELYER